ncbi:MAG TPA: hypothetical protein ENH10_04765, partial [Bacteroidetes bacterium]|nr:hypothetical protein [Bacteroidota bacterium]HEX04453.1 hypothetical protein [Bacteroidota bacterium]
MTDAKQLASAERAALIAPAGYGKTHMIAEAVANHSKGKQLILTHTHAGVDALRKKLRLLGASSSSFHVETIAGWALKYAASYPMLSSLDIQKPRAQDWNLVYPAARIVIADTPVTSVVSRTYAGVYVDEYQDCTIDQHDLILALADILPCRILGDPLQGIFDFKGMKPVNWVDHVDSNFESLQELEYPWRWKDKNVALGEWLKEVRQKLLSREPIDLAATPSRSMDYYELKTPEDQRKAGWKLVGRCKKETGIVIFNREQVNHCAKYVNVKSPGWFSCIE